MIDIKELRIGSHVLQYGVRVKVVEFRPPYVGVIYYEYDSVADTEIEYEKAKNLDPIPITEELLKELGFEKNKTELHFDYEKFPKDGLGIFINKIKENLIRVEVWDNVIHRGNMLCQYLHELENFVYMTTKQELI